jgi:hypothetical protein
MTKPAAPGRGDARSPRDVERGAPSSGSPDTARMPVGADYRAEMPTYTDPAELEAARVKSTFTTQPPSKPAAAASEPSKPPTVASEELSPEEWLAAYELRFGGFHRVPIVVVSADELAARSMDGRASMLLACLDGRSSIQTILDIGIVNTLDALAGLAELVERGVIRFKEKA